MMNSRIIKKWLPKTIVLFLFHTCVSSAFAMEQTFITLASTTSTENSGLLKHLIPKFKKKLISTFA